MTSQRGLTLIELVIALAVMALLAALALPAWQNQATQGRRADATGALQRLQMAQERHRAAHGLYAGELQALGAAGAATSAAGLYRIELQPAGADAYMAVARARGDGPQALDNLCAEITLKVDQGFANLGPTARCWNR
jgi:type IV pilus assembly protein PilE